MVIFIRIIPTNGPAGHVVRGRLAATLRRSRGRRNRSHDGGGCCASGICSSASMRVWFRTARLKVLVRFV